MARFIFIILLSIFYQFGSAEAITKRPGKECQLCHVLWFDALKTDKQTLLPHKESSIVIAGAMGLASSRQMCDTCHDGYIVDSRVKVVKGNPHHGLNKVPDWLKLPQDFRLDSNNEIYCGTCHTLHNIRGGETVGSTPFLRLDNERSQMCVACHAGKTEQQDYINHPVLRSTENVPFMQSVKKGVKLGPKREILCQSCHNPHGSRALAVPLRNSTLCLTCHRNKKSLVDTKHDLRITLPEATNIKQQRPSESGPCGACHIPHNAGNKRLWARKPEPGNPASKMCLSCHGEKSGFQIKRIGTFSHPTDVEPVSKAKIPKELPLYSTGLKKTPEGRVQCFTCHEVHNWNPASLTDKGAKNVEGDASNSFLRLPNSSSSMLCLQCHIDKKQLLTSDHNLKVTAPEEKNMQQFAVRTSGPCGACHIPHNANGRRLWARGLSGEKNIVSQFCIGCHNKEGAAKAKLIGDYYHPVDVTLQKLNINGSKEKISSVLPLYNGDGDRAAGARIVCLTCHEPHRWSPNHRAPDPNYAFENMEGDAANSFLRKTNYPSSDLCGTCHSNEALVDGTDHDLNVTAPSSINILGQRPAESGVCGVCHLVHNSKNRFKLWAQEYGKGYSRTEAMCRSCHWENGYAKRKIPVIASHPEGKLISNSGRNIKYLPGYFPLFNKISGEPITVGDFSCPSCHNAHQWSPFFKKKGVNNNLEGTVMDSFLRNSSYNIICIDCHGPDALFRYQYFHNPDKRVADKRKTPRPLK